MIKFSVVTVAKNAAATLQQCIASVAAQRYSALEYIIIDGASTDDTAAIVSRHKARVDRFVSEPDRGIYDAMNKALKLASGDFVHFLGADDYFVDGNVLQEVASFIEQAGGCDLVYGGIEVRHPSGRTEVFMPPPAESALRFLVSGCLPHQASFASRRAFELTGGFDDRYRIAGDYDWFLRVVTDPRLVTRRFERMIASYRIDGVSNRLAQSQREAFAIQNAVPVFRQPEWLQRRIGIYLRDSLAYGRQAEALSRRLGPRIWLRKTIRLLGCFGAYPFERLIASLRPQTLREPALARLQDRVLRQRIENDDLGRRSNPSGQPLRAQAAPD
jgi:glycosyltransferase involved in cell wall biosynthesis